VRILEYNMSYGDGILLLSPCNTPCLGFVEEMFSHRTLPLSKVCAFVTWIKQHSVVMFIRQRYLLLIFYVKQNRNVDTKVTQQNWFRFFIRFNSSCFKSFDFRKCRGKSWWRRNRTRCWGRRRSIEFGVKRKILPLLTFYIQNNINLPSHADN